MGVCKAIAPELRKCTPDHQLHLLLHTLQLTIAQPEHLRQVARRQLRRCPKSLLHLQSECMSAVLDVSSCLKKATDVSAQLGVMGGTIVLLKPEVQGLAFQQSTRSDWRLQT